MSRRAHPFIRVIIWIAFAPAFLGLIAVTIYTENQKAAAEPPKWEQRNAKYGVDLGQYDYTRCINGWLATKPGTHGYIYVRDADFNPIRCEGK